MKRTVRKKKRKSKKEEVRKERTDKGSGDVHGNCLFKVYHVHSRYLAVLIIQISNTWTTAWDICPKKRRKRRRRRRKRITNS